MLGALVLLCIFLILPSGAMAQAVARTDAPVSDRQSQLHGYCSTGIERPGFEKFDQIVTSYMRLRGIPGGALAVTRGGRLVYARGYGLADKQTKQPVQPDSLFRIASLSKCFTSAAIMTLVQSGRLSLDEKVFSLLPVKLPSGCREDVRIKQITIRQLLQHSGGWDRDRAPQFDPMFSSGMIARSFGKTPPATRWDIIRYMLARPLDFEPGTRFAYSNFGYCLLGRVIERVSGRSYQDFVQEKVLLPCGIKDMRLGRTLVENAAPGEVHYYQPEDGLHEPVFPDRGFVVPAPYGAWCLENMDSHGGWLGSVIDLVRFASVLDFPGRHPLLGPKAMTEISTRPLSPLWMNNGKPMDHYYGLGWNVRPVNSLKSNYWHVGSLEGSFGLMVRRYDGLAWAVLFNQRSTRPRLPSESIDGDLHVAADSVRSWPGDDLFSSYGFPVK